MRRFTFVSLGCLLSCSSATKEPVEQRPSATEPAGAPLVMQQPASAELGARWETTEGAWRGTWVRRASSDVFDGTWSSQQYPTFKGTLKIRLDARAVVVERQDLDGFPGTSSANKCVYRASIDATGSNVVEGTVSCVRTVAWSIRGARESCASESRDLTARLADSTSPSEGYFVSDSTCGASSIVGRRGGSDVAGGVGGSSHGNGLRSAKQMRRPSARPS